MRAYLLLTVCALVAGAAIATSGGPAQDRLVFGQQQKADRAEFESQFPVADIDKGGPSDQKKHDRWQAKGKKYKRIGLPITEKSDLITYHTEWDMGLPALPVSKSELVVLGEVVDAQAYVSGNKNWVYSEFTIKVDEVLKNTGNITLSQGATLVVDRDGGGVRFPSGKLVIQHIVGQRMPRAGRRYAFFLTPDDQGQGLHILTGYELRGGRVFPLDNPGGGQHPITTAYNDVEESSFLSELQAAIATSQ